MRPYTIHLPDGHTMTLDLEHLIAIHGPFVEREGVFCNLQFLFRDAPIRLFGGYYKETEQSFENGEFYLLKPDGARTLHFSPDAHETLAVANFKRSIMKPLEDAWIEG